MAELLFFAIHCSHSWPRASKALVGEICPTEVLFCFVLWEYLSHLFMFQLKCLAFFSVDFVLFRVGLALFNVGLMLLVYISGGCFASKVVHSSGEKPRMRQNFHCCRRRSCEQNLENAREKGVMQKPLQTRQAAKTPCKSAAKLNPP